MQKILLLSLLLFAGSSFSKGMSPAVTAAPGGYNIRAASNGTPLAVPVTNLPAGGVGVVLPTTLRLPGGIDYPAVATAVITAASMAGPWGSAIAVALAAGSIGVAVLDQALASAKLRIKPGGVIEVADPLVCTESPCYEFKVGYSDTYNRPAIWVKSTAQSCVDGAAFRANDLSSLGAVATVISNTPQCSFRLNFSDGGAQNEAFAYQRREVTPSQSAYNPISSTQAVALLTGRAPTAAEVQALIDLNFPPAAEIPTITGPASVPKSNTIDMGLNGSVREIDERYIASFSPGFAGFNVASTTTVKTPARSNTSITTNPDGSTSTTVTTIPGTTSTLTTTTATPQPSTPEALSVTIETCGLPGKPACKIDETGTPPVVDKDVFKPLADKNKLDADAARSTIAGTSDKPFFSGWGEFFFIPPVVACSPFELPRSMGFIDPCPVANGMRSVMAWLWAVGGLYLCLGMVRKVV